MIYRCGAKKLFWLGVQDLNELPMLSIKFLVSNGILNFAWILKRRRVV